MPAPTKFSAWLKRTLWSGLSAALTAVLAAPILDMAVWKAAAFAGLMTVVSALSIYARAQADSLPEVAKPV